MLPAVARRAEGERKHATIEQTAALFAEQRSSYAAYVCMVAPQLHATAFAPCGLAVALRIQVAALPAVIWHDTQRYSNR